MGQDRLNAGSATVDITPPVGSPMACFPVVRGEEPRRAEGVHQRLLASALVLSDANTPICLCSCDVSMIHLVDVRTIREKVGKEVPELAGPNLVIAATHTHSGPENTYLFGSNPGDEEIRELNGKIAEAVVRAARSLQPCRLSVAAGSLHTSHNRRVENDAGRSEMVMERSPGRTKGPVDPTLLALRCQALDNRPIGIVFNWTAHALTLGPGNRLFSPDYPGVARQRIQREYSDAPTLFFNGAAGNIHPESCMRSGPQATDEIGNQLGDAVLRLLERAEEFKPFPLNFTSRTLRFPNRVEPGLEVEVEISRLRMGPATFAFVPGEVFVEFQREYRRQRDDPYAFFVGYANGWPGYIPTRQAYESGGYGVDLCTTDPPRFSRTALPPGAGEDMLEALLEL